MSEKKLNIALVGSPNSGKTTLFNQLTGLNQHVGNYSGVTIDKKIGTVKHQDKQATILDLPGTFSLYPVAEDERVVLSTLLEKENKDYPDLIVFIANANSLKKGMLLLSQLIELHIPIIFCLNKIDSSEKKGYEIDADKLSSRLNIPIIQTVARKNIGIDVLKDQIFSHDGQAKSSLNIGQTSVPKWIDQVKTITGIESDYSALLALCDYKRLNILSEETRQQLSDLIEQKDFKPIVAEVEDKKSRISSIGDIIQDVVKKKTGEFASTTDKLDRILTHNVYGTIIFVLILFLIFQGVFSFSEVPMDLIDQAFGKLNSWVNSFLPDSWWQSLITDGLITGIGGIVIFVPQIAILFGLIALLEQSGYMPRMIYLSDKIMSKFGMNGRSLVALISGVACAVPAIMSARSISNKKERLITIFVTPFISCSARLPVFVILTAFVVPDDKILGFINLQGLVLFGLYFLGFFTALFTSYILHKVFKSEEQSMLTLELPSYQWPNLKSVLITLIEKTKIFVVDAGKIILIISVVLWALVSYGPGNKMNDLETDVQTILNNEQNGLTETEISDLNNHLAAQKLEFSYAGYLGKAIEPAIRPLGFDWKMGIALITSFAAREVFISTMATIYSAGSDDEKTIRERMRDERDYLTGSKTYTPARSFSLLLFYVFAMQCMSTLAIAKRETKSWGFPIAQLVFMTAVAYLASWLAFSIMS